MAEGKVIKEPMDLGRFLQQELGGEFLPSQDGTVPCFTIRNPSIFNSDIIRAKISEFYQQRGFQKPNSRELYFEQRMGDEVHKTVVQSRHIGLDIACEKDYYKRSYYISVSD